MGPGFENYTIWVLGCALNSYVHTMICSHNDTEECYNVFSILLFLFRMKVNRNRPMMSKQHASFPFFLGTVTM